MGTQCAYMGAGLVASVALGLGIGINIWQNGPADHPPPTIKTADEALRVPAKRDFVSAWRNADTKRLERSAYAGRTFDAALVPLGVLSPLSSFITHVLFGGIVGGRWQGKRFSAAEEGGDNSFVTAGYQHRCVAALAQPVDAENFATAASQLQS